MKHTGVLPSLAVVLINAALTATALGGWIGTGPQFKTIKALAVSPQHSNVVYAAAFGWGVFRSTDAGATWTNSKTNMINTYARSLLVLSDSVVYAGTNGGVYKSIDSGSTWNLVLQTSVSVRGMALDPATGAIYAASYGAGLYKSTNGGGAWTQITVTDPNTLQTLSHLWTVAVFGHDSLYVGGSILDIPQGNGGSLFQSVNGGTSWFQVQYPTAIRSSIHAIAISPTAPATTFIIGTAVKGVYLSTDGGIGFTNIDGSGTTTHPLPDLHLNTVAISGGVYYAGTDSLGGLYSRSISDVSNGWTPGTGLPGAPAQVNHFVADNANPGTFYLGTDNSGVFKSVNSGSSWQASRTGMMGTAAFSLKFNSDGKLFLGTDFGDGMWKSADSGKTWTHVDSLSTVDGVMSIATTTNPLVLYAGTFGGGVHLSTDGGVIWRVTDTTTMNHFVRPILTDPTNGNTVYAGTNNGMYKTTNAGTSWFAINSGIPAGASVRALDLVQSAPGILLAGTDSNYLYRSTNGGASWTNITSASGFLPQDIHIRSITIDQTTPSIVYAGADSGRMYNSADGGLHWTLLYAIPAGNSVRAIRIHPTNRGILFAATFGQGVLVSVDTGHHWTSLATGLTDSAEATLLLDNANPVGLYAGSHASGVFLNSYAIVDHPPSIAPIGNKSVYPNQLLAFTVTATDPDGTIPTLSASGLPSGAVFSDAGGGHGNFSWTPASNQTGTFQTTFRASDGTLSDSQTITITVLNAPKPSIAPIGNKAVYANHLLAFTVTATDPDSTIPSLSASGLPAGASFTDAGGGKGNFSWTPTSGQLGNYLTTFRAINGTSADSQTIHIAVLDSATSIVVTLQEAQGWNMVSLPDVPPDRLKSSVFPTAISAAFGYSGSYLKYDTLQVGVGYWLNFSSSQSDDVGGLRISLDTLSLNGGWNIIGSLSTPVAVSSVQAIPPMTLQSAFFGYSGGYAIADTLRPGSSYWVRASQAGSLVMSAAAQALAGRTAGVPPSQERTSPEIGINTLTFTDAMKRTETLRFSSERSALNEAAADLPPLPPPGAFDVRFATQKSAAVFDHTPGHRNAAIQLNGAIPPVTVQWHIGSDPVAYYLASGGERSTGRSLASDGSMILSTTSEEALTLSAGSAQVQGVPQLPELDQNYPNPFNPSTTIRYRIFDARNVKLEVYDLLGRLVASLVDNVLQPGEYAVSLNAGNLASGVYIYRLTTSPLSIDGHPASTETRSLVILR